MLVGIARAYGAAFGSHFMMLSVLLAILSPVIIQPPQMTTLQLATGKWSAVASLLVRWLFMLAVLLAIGYVTKFSEDFSRRVVVTWAVVTPVPLILVAARAQRGDAAPDVSRSNVRISGVCRLQRGQRRVGRAPQGQPRRSASRSTDSSTTGARSGSAWRRARRCSAD